MNDPLDPPDPDPVRDFAGAIPTFAPGRVRPRPPHAQRNPLIAALASFFVVGLGQLYNGEWLKSLLLIAASIALSTFWVLAIFHPTAYVFGFVGIVTVSLVLWLASAVDAFVVASQRGRDYVLRPFNRVLLYLAYAGVLHLGRMQWQAWVGENLVASQFVFSDHMSPTLLTGDWVFVDRRPSTFFPRRGDVVLVAGEREGQVPDFLRIVSTGGRSVELRDRVLFLDGHDVPEPYATHIDSVILEGVTSGADQFGPQRLSSGEYFVLGDNRERSRDSRDFGAVEPPSILGRAMWIVYSVDREDKTRWERVGRRVR